MITEQDGKERGFGPYAVTEIDNHFVGLQDSTRLAIKVWYPEEDFSRTSFCSEKSQLLYRPARARETATYPVVLEYLPYRRDYTAPRDHKRHPWFASHGYVVVRCDMRGTGSSDGLYYDEYLPQEQEDCSELIAWLAAQTWCNGAVGMYGKSWGGANGLQVSCEQQPAALKAVISLFSMHDRYTQDIHHDGGCVIAHGLLSWASYMFCFNARCPDPRHRPDWKQVWRERLEKTSYPWVKTWLSHQTKDDYWQHASVSRDPQRLHCPLLAIGGWRDGYTDSVFRLVRDIPHCKGIVGPWAHEWPDECKPGPNMDYLRVCLEWWDYHLKGSQNGAMEQPKIRVYANDSFLPSRECTFNPGRWISFDNWPPKTNHEDRTFHGDPQLSLLPVGSVTSALPSVEQPPSDFLAVPFDVRCGSNGPGAWLSFGEADMAENQVADDNRSLSFTSEPLDEPLCIVGFPRLSSKMAVDNHNGGVVIARLCDVFPDSTKSTLITYAVLNLTHHKGHGREEVKALESSKVIDVDLTFHSTGYSLPSGHRLRVAVSSNWWPQIWPSAKSVKMRMQCPKLTVPVYTGSENRTELICPKPAIGPPIPHEMLEPSSFSLQTSDSNGECTHQIKCNFGRMLLTSQDVLFNHRYDEDYSVKEADPLTTKAKSKHSFELSWPNFEGGMETMVKTESTMEADEEDFVLENKLKVYLNGEVFFAKDWSDRIKREFV